MKEDLTKNRISEGKDGLCIAYPASARIELAFALFMYAAVLVACHYVWYMAGASLFADHYWSLIPICLLGDAGLIAYFLSTGCLKSTVIISTDGTVRQGVAIWKFPGPMTALVAKEGGVKSPPTFSIDLRYGRAVVRLPGGTTEGQSIGISVQINHWCRHRIQGISDPFDARGTRPTARPGNYLCVLMLIVCLAVGVFARNDVYLDEHATAGTWAKMSTAILLLLVASATGIRWRTFARAGVQRGAGILLTEGAIAMLLALGSGAIAARAAQTLETSVTLGAVSTFEAPLIPTVRRTGKGCHRYLTFNDPSLGRFIQCCDPHSPEYWNNATRVRVTQNRNDLGVHILSIDGAT